MEDILKSVRDLGQDSPVFSVVTTKFGEIVQELTRLTSSGNPPGADLEAVRSLRDLFEQAQDSLWCTVDVDEPTTAETESGSVELMGDETAESVTNVEAPQESYSHSGPLVHTISVRTDPSRHWDDLRRWWQETSDQAKQWDYANPSDPADGPAALWSALHLLYLRLPASYVAEQRSAVARGVGLEVGVHDVVIPGFADCAELDFGSSDSIALVHKQQKFVIESCGRAAWDRHRALLDPLVNVLTLIEMDDQNLKLPLWAICRQSNLEGVDASHRKGDFRDRVAERLNLLKKYTTSAVATAEELNALVAVLETVRSVTYRQMPALDSWWAENAKNADAHVGNEFAHAGDSMFKVVTGSHLFGKLTMSNEDIAVNRPKWAKQAKQVLWTLRPYIQLPDRPPQLGRVIYAKS